MSCYALIIALLVVATNASPAMVLRDTPVEEVGSNTLQIGKNTNARLLRIYDMKIALAKEELRALGTFLEEYTEQEKAPYPGRRAYVVDFQEAFKDSIDPSHLQRLPTLDPWGKAYRYWTDGSSYFIVSSGPDAAPGIDYNSYREPSVDWSNICSGGDDLVFYDGRLCG